MKKRAQFGLVLVAGAVAAVAYAATALQFQPAVNVSQTATPTEKAKDVVLAYADGGAFKKAWLYTYADGPVGRQNVYAKTSFDQGATWSAPVLLSRDAAGNPTGGQSVVDKYALTWVTDNDKPNIFAPPVTSGARAIVTWTSAYCPQDAAGAGNQGGYTSTVQGSSDQTGDGIHDRPFYCVWTATTTDPTLASWDVQQLTNGTRDAIGDVVAGNATGTAYAIAWQEDPAGLQPGEAEGPGDGGSGAVVSAGTNIWYTHAASLTGAGPTFRTNIAQVSNNNSTTVGQPGASRANLQISGSTAALAYEETACPGGTGGRCIVYHSFPFAGHDTDSAGTIISDPAKNARRVRFSLQGDAAAGTSPLRAVVIWREASTIVPGAPSDIVMRRGLKDTTARPGSTGYLPSDIMADTPQSMTAVAASGGNANAHRAIMRGGFVALAYDQTPNMDGANPERTSPPTANYNLYLTRSLADGAPGSWSEARNVTNIASPLVNVVEPRLVPTPNTIVNPITGVADAGDTQNTNVFYLSYATESNDLAKAAGKVYVTRSTDQAASFEPFVPVSAAAAGQSEAQLRATPDGSSLGVLWMGEQTIGDPLTKDAMFAVAAPIEVPNLAVSANAISFELDSHGHLALTVNNAGTGAATNVLLSATVPSGLTVIGTDQPASCTVAGSTVNCAFGNLAAGESRVVAVSLRGASVQSYSVPVSVTNDVVDADSADNSITVTVDVTENSGGCTMARRNAPFDPTLPLLAAVGLISLALRRVRRS